jgi:hypothetical protein
MPRPRPIGCLEGIQSAGASKLDAFSRQTHFTQERRRPLSAFRPATGFNRAAAVVAISLTTLTRFGHHIDREQRPATGSPALGISFLSFGSELSTWFSQ